MQYVLVYDQDQEKQKDFKNVVSFRVTFVSTGQIYKPLAEIDLKWEHKRILQIIVGADFVNSALLIFTRAKHVVQWQRMWNVAFVTISSTHTKLHHA